ncbi:hypothetical protein HN51_024905 [Arachis hypogaea]
MILRSKSEPQPQSRTLRMQDHVTVEIDAANGVIESGDDNYLNAFQSSYDDGEQQMHDDGYSWRKYEENPLRRGNQTSCYRCAHPNCKVKKKVERTIDGEIIHVNYKGTHAHYRKPRFTIKRNSSSESFYSYLSSKPFHTDMIDQSLLAFNGNGQLDHNSTRELIIINMTCEMLNFSMLRIKMCQKADEDHSSGQLVENPLESVIAVIVC